MASVTRRPDCVFNIWPFSTIKICPKAYKLYQNELKTFPKTKQTLKYCQTFLKIGQGGGILPNLVILVVAQLTELWCTRGQWFESGHRHFENFVCYKIGPFFGLYPTDDAMITTHKCGKCMRCWDSNPRPLEHRSFPITTRHRLPPEPMFVC